MAWSMQQESFLAYSLDAHVSYPSYLIGGGIATSKPPHVP